MPTPTSAASSSAPPPAALERRVRDVMRRDFVRISAGETLLEALELMRLARLRHLTIEDAGLLVGVLSYRDLQDALLGPLGARGAPGAPALPTTTAVERLAAAPFSIAPDATLGEAVARLDSLKVGCLPVVERSEQGLRVLGLLTELDLLRAAFGRS